MRAKDPQEQNLDGYIRLAAAIIDQAGDEYSWMFPVNATSQEEFDHLDINYKYRRQAILDNLINSAVRAVLDYETCYSAFEYRRHQRMKEYGITWE